MAVCMLSSCTEPGSFDVSTSESSFQAHCGSLGEGRNCYAAVIDLGLLCDPKIRDDCGFQGTPAYIPPEASVRVWDDSGTDSDLQSTKKNDPHTLDFASRSFLVYFVGEIHHTKSGC